MYRPRSAFCGGRAAAWGCTAGTGKWARAPGTAPSVCRTHPDDKADRADGGHEEQQSKDGEDLLVDHLLQARLFDRRRAADPPHESHKKGQGLVGADPRTLGQGADQGDQGTGRGPSGPGDRALAKWTKWTRGLGADQGARGLGADQGTRGLGADHGARGLGADQGARGLGADQGDQGTGRGLDVEGASAPPHPAPVPSRLRPRLRPRPTPPRFPPASAPRPTPHLLQPASDVPGVAQQLGLVAGVDHQAKDPRSVAQHAALCGLHVGAGAVSGPRHFRPVRARGSRTRSRI